MLLHPPTLPLCLSGCRRGVGHPAAPAAASFLAEALMQLQRRPHEFFELAQLGDGGNGTGSGGGSGEGPVEGCLLAACALRQALRVLPSPKMPAADKAAIAGYVAATLGALLRQQHSVASAAGDGAPRGAAARFARVLLGVLRSEAQRQQAQSGGEAGEGKKRRKGEAAEGGSGGGQPARLELPAEGQCIASLAALLEQELLALEAREAAEAGEAAVAEGAEAPRKKRRKSEGGGAPQVRSHSGAICVPASLETMSERQRRAAGAACGAACSFSAK